MFTSFSTALSALSAHSTAVDVVGNNLANLNTPGYKTSTVSFRDLVTQSLGEHLTAHPIELESWNSFLCCSGPANDPCRAC